MEAITLFIKSNKFFVGALVVIVVLALIEMYGYSQKSLGEQTVVAKVNGETAKALDKNEKDGAAATDQAEKDINQGKADSQGFDQKQGAKEVSIRKKYSTKQIDAVVNGKKVVEEVTVPLPPATMPNGMEAELSDSRIDDAWTRYCHFKQQDGQPCVH